MKEFVLDKEKRYKFAGDVYRFDSDLPSWWVVGGRTWLQDEFQYFANAGLVTEFVEPKPIEFETTVMTFSSGSYVGSSQLDRLANKHVRVTVTEVQ